jgi:hypothetical protein
MHKLVQWEWVQRLAMAGGLIKNEAKIFLSTKTIT